MQSSLLQQGMDLMVFGMGTVFVFLTLLVISVSIMSRIIRKYFHAQEVLPESIASASMVTHPVTPGTVVDPATLAVIQEAIYRHRAKNNLKK